MLEALKQRVCAENLRLKEYGLVVLTWGNVSAISEDRKYVVIKPSGVSYAAMQPNDMVVVDLDGNIVEGTLRPSSDLPTHLELYRAFPTIGGVVHTHSRYATANAQAECALECYGTTHADYFHGAVPCTRPLTQEEIESAYETNTGLVIRDTFAELQLSPDAIPAVLVAKHGPFAWGPSPEKAVENALVLEECCRMALLTKQFDSAVTPAPQHLLDKHYYRKHGPNAYYGQK